MCGIEQKMRTVYILILLFLVACIIGAEIYIHQIDSTSFLSAPTVSRALWIIEFLVMLLIACLIGFAIAWYLQQDSKERQQEELDQFGIERRSLTTKIDQLNEQLSKAQSQPQHNVVQTDQSDEIRKITHEKERLKEEFNSIQAYIDEIKAEKNQLKRKTESLERELQLSLDNASLLKNSVERAKNENENLHAKLTKSFTLPAKDDLKLIHGIGPSIEKKLNALGIYSFRQISEFTSRTIDEITEAIKFFPGRIERDNWVSQARNLEEEKKRQASEI